MQTFRLYLLDREGHIYQAQQVSAPDESAALSAASAAAPNSRWELWDEARLVSQSADYQRLQS